MLISRDILNLKLYFIIGLPTETEEDLDELVRLVETIRERVIERGRANKRLGEITLSVNPFIPKPFTPFQWCGMEPLPSLERKVKLLEKRLRPLSNVRLKVESLRESYLQALLSRGDRRLSPLLVAMAGRSQSQEGAPGRAASIRIGTCSARSLPTRSCRGASSARRRWPCCAESMTGRWPEKGNSHEDLYDVQEGL